MRYARLLFAGCACALLIGAAGCGPHDDTPTGKLGTVHFAHGNGPTAEDLKRLAAHMPGGAKNGTAPSDGNASPAPH